MESDKKRSVNWLSTALIGALMVITGGMIIFFPKAAISMVMVMAAVILFVMGFTDMIAALRYKSDTQSWKTTLSSGIVTLLVGIFMGVTIYMPVDVMTIVIVLCAWAVIRCLCTLVGVIFGNLRRKGTIISSVILGIAGILVFLFRDVIAASTLVIGYGLLALGAVLLIAGFYSRAALNEKTEAIEQKKREEKKKQLEEKFVEIATEEEAIATGLDLTEGPAEEAAPEETAEEAADEAAEEVPEEAAEETQAETPEETKEPKEASSSEETDAGTEAAEETSPDAAAEEEPEPEKKGFFSFFK